MKKITIAGLGYVGLNLSILLAKYYEVIGIDIDEHKINIDLDTYIKNNSDFSNFCENEKLNLKFTSDSRIAYKDRNVIIISTPTNLNKYTNELDTTSIENVIDELIEYNTQALIVIKSTIPIGFMDYLCNKYKELDFLFAPEFLRESTAFNDLLHPDRLVVGVKNKENTELNKIYRNSILNIIDVQEDKVFFMNYKEAESVKLFSNAFLSMRIGFFNELDTFALKTGIDSKSIIDGVCSDSRIGNYYNKPSIGFGGYCLPKDTQQLSSSLKNIPHPIIDSINLSNEFRKQFITKELINMKPKKLGIYRLVTNLRSDNFRNSPVLDIIKDLKEQNSKINIIIYEPLIKTSEFEGNLVENNLREFKLQADTILAVRMTKEIEDVSNKVFTRDV